MYFMLYVDVFASTIDKQMNKDFQCWSLTRCEYAALFCLIVCAFSSAHLHFTSFFLRYYLFGRAYTKLQHTDVINKYIKNSCLIYHVALIDI